MGFTTWAMVEHEADDALGAAAAVADADERVEQVLIVTPDKDLGQCVRGTRVVQYDRRKGEIVDEDGVIAKFGVGPASIADYLALVGDRADGYPGPRPAGGRRAPRRCSPSSARLEEIPPSSGEWGLPGLRGAEKLAVTLPRQLRRLPCCSGGSPRSSSTSPVGDGRRLAVDGPTDGFAGARRRRPGRAAAGRRGPRRSRRPERDNTRRVR